MRPRSWEVRGDRRGRALRRGLGHLGPSSRLPQLSEGLDVTAELLDDQLQVTPPREARTAEDVVHRRVAEHAAADAGGDLANSGLARVQVQLVEPIEQLGHRTCRRRFPFELHDLPYRQALFNPVSNRQLITSDPPDQVLCGRSVHDRQKRTRGVHQIGKPVNRTRRGRRLEAGAGRRRSRVPGVIVMISSVPWWAWLVPVARPLFQLTLSVVICVLHRRATGSWPTVPDWGAVPETHVPHEVPGRGAVPVPPPGAGSSGVPRPAG
jgi:hypothetical protein